MGFMDAFGTVLDRVGGAVSGFVLSGGNPAGAITGLAGVERAKKEQKALERAEFMYMQDPGLSQGFSGVSPTASASPGFFAPGGALRTGVRDLGGFFSDFAPVASVFGLGDRFSQVPASGATTMPRCPSSSMGSLSVPARIARIR